MLALTGTITTPSSFISKKSPVLISTTEMLVFCEKVTFKLTVQDTKPVRPTIRDAGPMAGPVLHIIF
jgi:hypothetical protein